MITNKWIMGIEDLSIVEKLRLEVFNINLDEKDSYSWHILVYNEDEPIAIARMYPKEHNEWVVDYLGVIEQSRNKKIGDLLMRLVNLKCEQLGVTKVYSPIHTFFKNYGFEQYDENFLVTDKIKLPVYCKHEG